jgi:transposase-like protein
VISLIPSRGDGFLTTAEAARLVGVRPETIRQWRRRGWLTAQGLDERGHPLHTPEAVRAAELRVRDNGIRKSGIDPRRLRQPVQTPGRADRL